MIKPNSFGPILTCCVLCAGLLLQSHAWAQKQHWKLAMKEAELRDVVQEISTVLGATVVLDPRVQGRITVISEKELDREGVRRIEPYPSDKREPHSGGSMQIPVRRNLCGCQR